MPLRALDPAIVVEVKIVEAIFTVIILFTLAVMLARSTRSRAMKAYAVGVAAILTVAVGISRVYLGVHWPSDVLAGWMGGVAWALLCYAVAEWLARRGDIEPERE